MSGYVHRLSPEPINHFFFFILASSPIQPSVHIMAESISCHIPRSIYWCDISTVDKIQLRNISALKKNISISVFIIPFSTFAVFYIIRFVFTFHFRTRCVFHLLCCCCDAVVLLSMRKRKQQGQRRVVSKQFQHIPCATYGRCISPQLKCIQLRNKCVLEAGRMK